MVKIRGNQNDALAMFAFYGEIIQPHMVFSVLDAMMAEGNQKKVHRAISMYIEHHDGMGRIGSLFSPASAGDDRATLTAPYTALFHTASTPPSIAFARFNEEEGYGDDDPRTVNDTWSNTGSRTAETIVELWIRYREKGRVEFGLNVESAHEENPGSTYFRVGTDAMESTIINLDKDIMKPLRDDAFWTEWEG